LTLTTALMAVGMSAAGQSTYKPVPTFTLSLPITEGSFKVMRGGKEAFMKPGHPMVLVAGDSVVNVSARPLKMEVRSAGGYLAGSLYLVDSTSVTFNSIARGDDGKWTIGLKLDYGTLDSLIDTARYGMVIDSAGCTITPVGTHFLVERSSALDNAMTVTTVFKGAVDLVRPGFYKTYYPLEYHVNEGQQLRFQNFEFRTPRGFYEKVTLGSKMVHRQSDIMSDQGH
jgi:hypothetical protein